MLLHPTCNHKSEKNTDLICAEVAFCALSLNLNPWDQLLPCEVELRVLRPPMGCMSYYSMTRVKSVIVKYLTQKRLSTSYNLDNVAIKQFLRS